MSEFKINPYLYWYPSDWLTDPEVRRLPVGPKAFYIDLICHLHSCFPYGYCALLNPLKSKKLQKQVIQTADQEVNLRVSLLLTIPLKEQLKIVDNIEADLSKYLPYDSAEIKSYIDILEQRGIISRSYNGIIYSRRMVKDMKKRVTAYLNGSKGGAPNLKHKKTRKKPVQSLEDNTLKGSEIQKQVNQTGKQGGYATADYIYSKGYIGREGEKGAEKNPVFAMQKIYESSFADLQKIGYSKKWTEEGFNEWKKFVDWVIEHGHTDLFITKFIDPPSFEEIWRKGFFHNADDPENDWWNLVVRKILSTGCQPTQNLYYRIPDYMRYLIKDKKGPKNIVQPTGNYELKIDS